MNGYTACATTSSCPPVTIASIKAAMRDARALTPPPHEQVIGLRVSQADMDELKRLPHAMPITFGGELSLRGLPVSVGPLLVKGQYLSDRADGSTHVHRDGKEVRIPAWDAFGLPAMVAEAIR